MKSALAHRLRPLLLATGPAFGRQAAGAEAEEARGIPQASQFSGRARMSTTVQVE